MAQLWSFGVIGTGLTGPKVEQDCNSGSGSDG